MLYGKSGKGKHIITTAKDSATEVPFACLSYFWRLSLNLRMTAMLAISMTALSASVANANTNLTLDLHHTSAAFTISHLTITKVSGQVPVIKGEVVIGADNIPTEVNATLDATKIETQDDHRDADLRSEKWFDTTKYPTITFHSTKVQSMGASEFTLVGELTMHGVTKPITLRGTYNGSAKDPYGHTQYGYSATGTVDRTAFGVGDAPAAIVGNDVSIDLQVDGFKK